MPRYVKLLDWAFNHPGKLWTLLLCLFGLSLFILKILPKQFLPNVDSHQLVVKLDMPKGTRLEKTGDVAGRIDQVLRDHSDVAHTNLTVGSSSNSPIDILGKNEGQIMVDLKRQRSSTADQIRTDLLNKMEPLERDGGKIEISKAGGPLSFMQSQTSPIMGVLTGSTLTALKEGAAKLVKELANVPGIIQVRSSWAQPAPEIRLSVDKKRAARIDLSVTDIARTVQTGYHGRKATEIYQEGKEIPVRIRLRENQRRDVRQLKSLLITGKRGQTWPLKEVAAVRMGLGPSQIDRLDQRRMVLVQADYASTASRSSKKKAEDIFVNFSSPRLHLEEAGEKKSQQESFLNLVMTLLVAILLVYSVMAIQFESLRQPFFILITIPFSLIGMSLGLFAMGKTLNAISTMGFLLLAGIVVNNGIVLIDFVNQAKNTGVPVKDALRQASQTRLRPILMTAVTTIAGLIPMALGIGEGAELQAPMAITVIFGLLMATVLTLFALPSLYLLFEKNSGRAP